MSQIDISFRAIELILIILLGNFWLTVGILSADSWPTVYQRSADRLLGELFFTFTEISGENSLEFADTKHLNQTTDPSLTQRK